MWLRSIESRVACGSRLPSASCAARPARWSSYSKPQSSASRTRSVASMISGPMPSPRMTVMVVVKIGVPCERMEFLGAGSAGEQAIELAFLLERVQVVEAADVVVADEDLRHGLAAGPFDHLGALVRFGVQRDFGPADVLALEQIARGDAERAGSAAVHDDGVVHG